MSDPLLSFSRRMNDALIKMAIVDEMVRTDHWQGIDECLTIKPKALMKFVDYADAALRAIRRFQQKPDALFVRKKLTENWPNQAEHGDKDARIL